MTDAFTVRVWPGMRLALSAQESSDLGDKISAAREKDR
jgi:hypothetical protein